MKPAIWTPSSGGSQSLNGTGGCSSTSWPGPSTANPIGASRQSARGMAVSSRSKRCTQNSGIARRRCSNG
eukprot:8722014-Pyramimonas_sp.AAC.1